MDAPALITVLIGGADDDFDKDEEKRARKAVHFRSLEGDPLLFDYFELVDNEFAHTLSHMVQKYEGSPSERATAIGNELSKLNDILPKLGNTYVVALLNTWRSLANSIAQASGGVLGYFSISEEESELIKLEMITYNPM